MIKLKAKSEYASATEHYRKGQVIEIDEGHAEWLQRDAPGTFEVVVEKVEKAPKQPPRDKVIRSAPKEK